MMHRYELNPSDDGTDVEYTARRRKRFARVVLIAGPLLLLVLVVAGVLATDPVGSLTSGAVPVEEVAVESVQLTPEVIRAEVRNVSSAPIGIAQVLVNEAYWAHEVADPKLDRLESTTVTIEYPWEPGQPLTLGFLTDNGSRIDHEIPVAVESPGRGLRDVAAFAWLGLLIGAVPVAIGLLWQPALRRLSQRLRFGLMAFTAGLLAFLLLDTVEEGLQAAGAAADSLNTTSLFVIGAVGMVALITLSQGVAARRHHDAQTPFPGLPSGLAGAYLLALAIGLHNFGEGLAVGTSIAVGEVALGTALVVGFIVHNSTEGLAIAMPVPVHESLSLGHFAGLTAVAGGPTAVGSVLGSWSVAPMWLALAFGAAAGALAQVLWAMRPVLNPPATRRGPVMVGFVTGLLVMYATVLLVA